MRLRPFNMIDVSGRVLSEALLDALKKPSRQKSAVRTGCRYNILKIPSSEWSAGFHMGKDDPQNEDDSRKFYLRLTPPPCELPIVCNWIAVLASVLRHFRRK